MTFAPTDFNLFILSLLILSGMVMIWLYPFIREAKENPIPVLPEVASTII